MGRLLVILGVVAAAAVADRRSSTRTEPGQTGFKGLRNRVMMRMMASMPEDSPPKLVMSILPRLQSQNEEILTLLREQNDLLRRSAGGRKSE